MSDRLTKAQRTAIGLFVLEHALNGTQHAALIDLIVSLVKPQADPRQSADYYCSACNGGPSDCTCETPNLIPTDPTPPETDTVRAWRRLAAECAAYLTREQLDDACNRAGWSASFCDPSGPRVTRTETNQ